MIAFIREAECIGCTKCLDVCPTDAIIGTAKYLHTVIPSLCIACELCLPPCPMDCIELRETDQPPYDHDDIRQRVKARKQRLAKQHTIENPSTTLQDKRSQIAAALARKGIS